MANIIIDTGQIQVEKLKRHLVKYEILIFDLDNTVFSEEVFDYYFFQAIAKNFFSMSDSSAEELSRNGIIQKRFSREKLFNNLFPRSSDKTINLIVEYYQNFKCGEILQSYSIRTLLKEMYILGKKNYIVTNGDPTRQMNKIIDLEIKKYLIDVYICHPLTNNKLKPNSEVLKKIGINKGAQECLIIGDNPIIDGEFAKRWSLDYYLFQYPKISMVP